MTELFSFFLIIGIGLVFSEVFFRLRLPYVTALIIAGMLLGPFGFSVVPPSHTLDFIGEIGIIFLMFMAGLEVNLKTLKRDERGIANIVLGTGVVPGIIGLIVGWWLALSPLGIMTMGALFISSSVAVVVPTIQALGFAKRRIGKLIISGTVIEDILSLVVVALLLQTRTPVNSISPLLYIPALLLLVGVLRFAVPRLADAFHKWTRVSRFESEIRFTVVTLLAIVFLFEIVGIHAIVGGFVAGFLLADVVRQERLRSKLHVIAYGIFIPVFFFLIGARTDFTIFSTLGEGIMIVGVVVLAMLGSKFFGGILGGRLNGFSWQEGAFIGAACMPQLSATLIVAFIAQDVGILNEQVVTAIVILSVISTFIAPTLTQLFGQKFNKKLS
jgi:Kef-type K+ transport system membrane component KefB